MAGKGEIDKIVACLNVAGNGIVDRTDNSERTMLHGAAEEGSEPLVDLLLERKASLNVVDFRLDTPLILAARNGHRLVVKRLMAAKADTTLRGYDNMTAEMTARERGFIDLAMLMNDADLDLWPVPYVCVRECSDVVLFAVGRY